MKAKIKWVENPNSWNLELNGQPIARIQPFGLRQFFVDMVEAPLKRCDSVDEAKRYILKEFNLPSG